MRRQKCACSNWSQRNILDFRITLLSWHTHLLLRKAPTCTIGTQGPSLCISSDIRNNHLSPIDGRNEVEGKPRKCARPQFGNGMLAELGEGNESPGHLCTHSSQHLILPALHPTGCKTSGVYSQAAFFFAVFPRLITVWADTR